MKTELALCHRPKTEKKPQICTNSFFRQTNQLSLAPVRACVAPVCDFKSEVEELPMIDFLGLVGEM